MYVLLPDVTSLSMGKSSAKFKGMRNKKSEKHENLNIRTKRKRGMESLESVQ